MDTQQASRGRTRRPGGVRRRRDVQRAVHLLAGIAIVAHVYGGDLVEPVGTPALQWIVIPAVVVTGIVMWKGHVLRRAWRTQRAARS